MTSSGSFRPTETETWLDKPLTALALLYWGFILLYAYTLWIPRPRYTILFVGGSLLVFILHEATTAVAEDDRTELALFGLLGAITIVTIGYVTVYFWELFYERPGVHYTHEFVLAALLVGVVVYLAHRAFGLAFVVVTGITMAYAYFGGHIPGIFGHGGLTGTRLLEVFVLDITGLFGSITRIIAAWVALFLLYTGLVQAYGAFDLILQLVSRTATRFRSGVAQFAVVASMLIGSINGSPSANAAMTGSFTIPMMKESGLRGDIAGGVEATASSSGQVMPPVMGSAAFVMASLLGITYFDVLVAGLVPAAIFIVTIAVGVHYATLRDAPDGLSPDIDVDTGAERRRHEMAFDALKFVIPFALLVYTLGVAQWTIISSAMVTVFAQLATGLLFPVVENVVTGEASLGSVVATYLRETLGGFRYGAIILAPIAIIIALITGIVDTINATGLPGSLTLALIDLAGGTMLIAAVIAMFICVLLGMGMPSVAAYTIVAILVAPTFVEAFLVPDLAAHYFVFYSAILSFITPPIATAAVVASGVAGANFWRTCLAAIRISVVLFVLPVVFLYNPVLLVGGEIDVRLLTALVVLLGGISITHGINYAGRWGSNRLADTGLRAVYVAAGLIVMVHPDLTISGAALLVAAVLASVQHLGTITAGIAERTG